MSFYTSLNGLKNAQTDLGVISHNIANVETYGFKSSSTQFSDIVVNSAQSNPKLTQGLGATVTAIEQNFKLGPTEQTGGALEIAIGGDGFFTKVGGASGETMYTRNGKFQMDASGNIHDGSDNRLQVFPTDAAGNVTSTTPVSAQIPLTNGSGSEFVSVTVSENGNINAGYADGTVDVIGKVALASFASPTGLKQTGASNWQSSGLSGAAKMGEPGVGLYGGLMSGSLERSNVDIAEELVGLITAQRNFQANAKAIDTATQISQTVINLRT
ncbi:flagellar hook-basal body complex protein [Aurantiacibacter xanthus]|uniref:Flagellar hook protein FlgE n=1 Tax=Aurantiacibacter xanthus TaxID=1784712 RepID=A0A3A1P255_9SPHN|nr:flagellar hook-basal body complex protein [Aurantiacibacter xanthus]RIV81349.1 flagellar hook-basal body complex protein [Aurantiacibacter xanthus]